MNNYKSCALWPEACNVPGNYSEDGHETIQQAEAVRDFLKRDGLGGNGQFFPLRAWVEKLDTPNNKLESIAQSWVGTPFCENSRVKGAGVSCHFGPAEILIEAGLLPADLEIPTGPPGWSRSQGVSIMETFLDGEGAKYFESLDAGLWTVDSGLPGDLLGFRVGRCVHHLGLLLDGGRMFHVMEGCGAIIAPNIPPMWLKRMTRAWRPKGLL